jgi:hypothetical protein
VPAEVAAAERPTCRSCRWLDHVPARSIYDVHDAGVSGIEYWICRGGPPKDTGWPIVPCPDTDYCRQHEPELALDALKPKEAARA